MPKSLEQHTVIELKQMAKAKGLHRYSSMRKAELIQLLSNIRVVSPTTHVVNKCESKICKPTSICNPVSGYCVTKTGKIGKKLLATNIHKKMNVFVPPTPVYKPNTSGWFMFTINDCVYCKNAKELFARLGIDYKEERIRSVLIETFKKSISVYTNGYTSFPMIFNSGKFIGGYNELVKWITKSNPIPESSPLHIADVKKVSQTSFIGRPWYALTCILYLIHRHPRDCVVIPEGLISKKGELTKQAYLISDFQDIELEWDHKMKQFLVPIRFWEGVRKCLESGARFIVLPLGLINHANFLIYDTKTKEMERFEPYGFVDLYYSYSSILEDSIKELFNKNIKDMIKIVYKPLNFCPYNSFQRIQEREKKWHINDPNGFCMIWSAWYADTRLSNPNKSREKVIKMSIDFLNKNPLSFTDFIRSYSSFISDVANDLKKMDHPKKVFGKYIQKYT